MVLLFLQTSISNILEFLNKPLFIIGNGSLSILSILLLIVSTILLFYFSSKIKKVLAFKVFKKYNIEHSTSLSIATLIKYIIIVLGMIIILQSTGIDFSSLAILFGALGVGIGFGLQNITNNYLSGIFILIEKPIKIGDRIEVGNTAGNVVNISARATTVVTNDDITIIVPNSEFVSQKVINWSHNHRMVRFNFPIYVAKHEDPEIVKKYLLEVAHENNSVLKEPKPDILFDDFEESSLKFNMRIWTTEYIDRPNVIKSQLYYAATKKFREKGIEIPLPQRDLHLKSGYSSNNIIKKQIDN